MTNEEFIAEVSRRGPESVKQLVDRIVVDREEKAILEALQKLNSIKDSLGVDIVIVRDDDDDDVFVLKLRRGGSTRTWRKI